MQVEKHTPLRNSMAQRIRALRTIQKTRYPKYHLGRTTEPRVLDTVLAETSLEDIVRAACAGWLSVQEPSENATLVQDGSENPGALLRHSTEVLLPAAQEAGFSMRNVRLVSRVAPVPWEDFTDDVLDLVDDVRMSDKAYAASLEDLWNRHQQSMLETEDERKAFALYLTLKARYEPAGIVASIPTNS